MIHFCREFSQIHVSALLIFNHLKSSYGSKDDDNDDDDDGNDDDDDDEQHQDDGSSFDGDENALFQMIAEAAASQGIPLQYILSQLHGIPIEEDSGPVDYPFDNLPKTLPEVAEFILSDKCQRILVLAGAGMSVVRKCIRLESSNVLGISLDRSTLLMLSPSSNYSVLIGFWNSRLSLRRWFVCHS